MADEAGLPYIKKESQDVCFLIIDGKIMAHNEFLKKNEWKNQGASADVGRIGFNTGGKNFGPVGY